VRSDHKYAAFYLADDLKTLMLVCATELSVGFPDRAAGGDLRPIV
jgi:hypothetical protein